MPKLSSVLLVDDDPTTNFLNELIVSTAEIAEQVLVAENGEEALHLLASGEAAAPALILLDMNMPVMNGLEFLEAYGQWPLPVRPVIILLTTSLHERDLARAQQLSVTGSLDKPLTEAKLLGVLHQHFPHVAESLSAKE